MISELNTTNDIFSKRFCSAGCIPMECKLACRYNIFLPSDTFLTECFPNLKLQTLNS